MTTKNELSTPYCQKVIYLKNGVKQGNPNLNAKRCGAKTRTTGLPCLGMAIKGKNRCRLHGGRSTGARTKEGLEKCRKGNWKHGLYSKELKLARLELNRFIHQQYRFIDYMV